jgi:hypothetical protein
MCELVSSDLGQSPAGCSCGYGNEPLGSIKCSEFLEQLNDYRSEEALCFYAYEMFINVFTKPRHWPLSLASSIQSTYSQHISTRSTLILFSRLLLYLPSGVLPWDFQTKFWTNLSTPLRSHGHLWPTLIFLYLIVITTSGEAHNLRSSSLHSLTFSNLFLNPVSIATSNGLDDRGSRVRFPAEAGSFSPQHRVQNGFGPTQLPIQWVPGAVSLGVKWPEREADHSPPSSAESQRMRGAIPPLPNTPPWRDAQFKKKSTRTALPLGPNFSSALCPQTPSV